MEHFRGSSAQNPSFAIRYSLADAINYGRREYTSDRAALWRL